MTERSVDEEPGRFAAVNPEAYKESIWGDLVDAIESNMKVEQQLYGVLEPYGVALLKWVDWMKSGGFQLPPEEIQAKCDSFTAQVDTKND